MTTIRDFVGDPRTWENHISDGDARTPNMDGATVLDIFVSGNHLSLYTEDGYGVRGLSIFHIDDPDIRTRIAKALSPGSNVVQAIASRLD